MPFVSLRMVISNAASTEGIPGLLMLFERDLKWVEIASASSHWPLQNLNWGLLVGAAHVNTHKRYVEGCSTAYWLLVNQLARRHYTWYVLALLARMHDLNS